MENRREEKLIPLTHICVTAHTANLVQTHQSKMDHSGRDRMVVGIYNYQCNQCISPITL